MKAGGVFLKRDNMLTCIFLSFFILVLAFFFFFFQWISDSDFSFERICFGLRAGSVE